MSATSSSPSRVHDTGGGLFLFSAALVRIDTDALAFAAKLPGSRMILRANEVSTQYR